MTERELFLRRFHDANPGVTARAFARGGSYERLAALVEPGARVLDLGCGDGHLLAVLAARGCRAVGLDVSRGELARARGDRVLARAQALPFAAGAFDAVVAHLTFMPFDALDDVAGELARVLAPHGRFVAVLGGGPVEATGDDAFRRFLAIAALAPLAFGDRRARSEAGWRALFPGWRVTFERVELDLSGTFADVWAVLGTSYQLVNADTVRTALEADYAAHARVPCRAVLWIASAAR